MEGKSEQRKGVPVKVSHAGSRPGVDGILYDYDVLFQDGTKGQYSSKSDNQDKFVEGVETDYEFINGKYPKVKPVYGGGKFANNSSKSSVYEKKSYGGPASSAAAGGKSYFKSKSKSEQAYIMAQNTFQRAVDMCIAGQIKKEEIRTYAEGGLKYCIEISAKYKDQIADD